MEKFIKTNGGTNFRSTPSITNNIIKSLAGGVIVQVLELVNGTTWYKAELSDGTIGYITSKPEYVSDYTPAWLSKAQAEVAYGEKYLGIPYVFGSNRTTDKDFDCSDFQQWIFEHAAGIDNLHWDSRSQCKYDGVRVDINDIRSGDLVFFSHDGTDGGVYHVSQYVNVNGEDRLLHTYSTTCDIFDRNLNRIRVGGGGVTYSDFSVGKYWRNRAYAVKRVISGDKFV